MRYTITIPANSEAKLQEQARAKGVPADEYIQQLVEDALERSLLRDVLAPIHQAFLVCGM